ncbi:MAG: hypothetical protein ACN4EF_02260 [Wenyingzhuangia sp.]|uniref:hypothetical protein n=1 Tax=Wenyingzhuangia sp. TaxID=1964193 RepID=UPI003219AC89|tara:strand:- start:2885 stop:3205 length:321 start_codon:yes stop_codon:yes gene_type:complete
MGALITTSIRVDKLPKEKFVMGKDGAVYYNFTISINDDSRYGNNVALTDSRTLEEKEAGKPLNYLGNGRVVWIKNAEGNSGKIFLAEKDETRELATSETTKSDLPF